MYKKVQLLLVLVISQVLSVQAQDTANGKIFTVENAFVGASGTFSLGGGNGTGLLIGINPMYGYYIKNWLDVGAVVNLQYNSFELDPVALSAGRQKKTFLAGLGLSSRIYPVDFLYIQAQPEINAIFAKEKPLTILGGTGATLTYNNLIPSLLVGAGMKRGFQKGRTFAYASILFDVLANEKSPYRNLSVLGSVGDILPIFRAGINMSLSDMKNKRNNN